jgi:hypothetical protein
LVWREQRRTFAFRSNNQRFDHLIHRAELHTKASFEHPSTEDMKHRDNRGRFCTTTTWISRKTSPLN